jgi:hypothetical protein
MVIALAWILNSSVCYCFELHSMYEVVQESFQTVIAVTASVKKMRGEAKVTLLQAYCFCLPHDTAL